MRNINPFGLLIVAVGVAASYCISIYQGLQLSPVAWISGIYALIGAAAVTWEMIGWHRCAHLAREGRHLAFAMNAAGLILASCVTILLFELAFLAGALEGMASRNAVAIDNRAALEMERSQLQASLNKGGSARGVEAVEADIEGIKAHPRWASSHACDPEWTTAKDSKSLCGRYADDLAELGAAKSMSAAQGRIREIGSQLTPLGQIGAADARALYLSRLTGSSEQGARIIVGLLVIMFLFFCRAIAPFTMWDTAPKGFTKPVEPVEPEDGSGGVEIIPLAPRANVVALRHAESEEDRERRLEAEALADMEDALAEMERENVERPKGVFAGGAGAGEDDGRPEDSGAVLLVRRFASECLIPDASSREKASYLYKAFMVWCADLELLPLDDHSAFGLAMTAIIARPPFNGRKTKSSGWHYVGVRLKPTVVHRVECQQPVVVINGNRDLPTGKALGPMVRSLGLSGFIDKQRVESA